MTEQEELETYKEFEKLLREALAIYGYVENKKYKPIDIFIDEKVWENKMKYHRMEMTTKQKFFESLHNKKSVEQYTKEIKELWESIDHTYMDQAIKELQRMVVQKDFKDAEMYGNKKITESSIKLENTRRDYVVEDKELYPLTPERDFKKLEDRYVNRHVKYYENMLNRYEDSTELETDLVKVMKRYDKMDKNIPYFYKDGSFKCWNDISTYSSMLYNTNLTRSAWNRTIYDSKLLGNHLFYLPAHPYSCEHCLEYQGFVYTDSEPITIEERNVLMQYGKPGSPRKENAIKGGVGHPNCKHPWTLFWSKEQIQDEKYNSSEWEEKYKTQQKIQSIDLQKSRLLTDRRIYQDLGNQELVDKTTTKIKALREKKKELETQL